MSKRLWALVVGTLLFAWAIDQMIKAWAAQNLGSLEFYGPFALVYHRNPGAILGAFSDLPPVLRIVSLSTGGAFLIFIYGALQYLIPGRFLTLRLGMSLLLGGILGNVHDRIRDGSVIDFIAVGSREFLSPVFNFADAIQWVGYAMIVFSLVRYGKELWPSVNARKQIWVMPRFQLKYCFLLMFIGFGFSVVAGVFAYTYLMVTIDDLVVGPSRTAEKRFLIPFLEIYALISLGFVIVLFLLGRVLSHRTAGPLYAFQMFLEDVLNGKDRPLKLREGDEFRHLEGLAERVRDRVRGHLGDSAGQPKPLANPSTPR